MRQVLLISVTAALLRGQTLDVPLTNRDTGAVVVASGGTATLQFTADPSAAGADLFQAVSSRSDVVVTLLLPDGTEINSANADSQGYSYNVLSQISALVEYIPGPMALSGTQTWIRLAPGARQGKYQLKIDGSQSAGSATVLASYFSSSPVGAGILTAPVYRTGDTVILSGMVFEGSQPVVGASPLVRIVDAANPTAAPTEVTLQDAGRFDVAPGDGIYTGTYAAANTGDFTAVLRVTGVSAAGVPFQRTATTTFRVQAPTARIASWKDAGLDANGDGIIDSVVVNARLTADVAGDYQAGIALLSAAGARIFSSKKFSLTQGDNAVTFTFSAADLAKLGQDGPYSVRDFTLLFLGAPGAPLADSRPDAGSTAPYTISGPIQGIQPSLNRLDFGTVAPGSSKDLTLAVNNSSSVSLILGALPLVGAAFRLVNPPIPFTLEARQQPVITVRFAPSAAGSFSGTLTVAGVIIPLSGSSSGTPPPGGGASVQVSPASLDFGSVNTGQSSQPMTITLTNSGTAPASITLSTNTPFTVSPASLTLAANGGAGTASVTFTPTAATASSGTVNATISGQSTPVASVSLTGTGITPTGGNPNFIRTLVYHEITSFTKQVRFSNGGMPVLSASGNRVVYANAPGDETDARYNHISVVNADGSGQRQVDVYKQNCFCGAVVDISADGNTVVSTDSVELRAASTSGSAGKRLITNREIPYLRISRGGDKVFFIHRRGDASATDPTTERGLYVINIDGSGLKQIVAPKAVAALLGITPDKVFPFSTNGWSLDVSADGTKLAFGVAAPGGERIFTVNADGSGLRQTLGPVDFVNHVALSGDGTKVAYDVTPPPCCSTPDELGIVNADGSNRKALATRTPDIGSGNRIQMSGDGKRLLYGGTSYLYATDGSGLVQLSARGGYYSPDKAPLVTDGFGQSTMNSTATRFLYIVRDDAGNPQLATMDINPSALGDAPSITAAALSQPSIGLSGAGQSLVTAAVSTSNTISRVSAVVLNAGIPDANVNGPVMLDDGTNGDQVASDGVYSGQISANCCATLGPKTVRVKAEVRDSGNRRHATAVEFGGLTVVSSAP